MKTLLLLLLAFNSITIAAKADTKNHQIPDLPPDAEISDYEMALANRPGMGIFAFDGLDHIFSLGNRNIEWLKFMNASRPDGQKLSFTSKDTQRGIPIDQPSEYNPALILAKLEETKSQMPAEMLAVIFDGKDFTQDPPVDTKIYLDMGRMLDRVYQSAARWRTMQPYLSYLAQRRSQDIRGVYFLSRLENRAEKLRGFENLPQEEKNLISDWLVSMCMNNGGGLSGCKSAIARLISTKAELEAYYQSKLSRSIALFNSYFEIKPFNARRDFIWNDISMVVPFLDPKSEEVRRFVQDNIEEEWKLGNWKLLINFVNSGSHPRIIFQPNITPHVNGLGGDSIYMNSTQPLTEYDANWTIRHEFGHVLAFPDCYVEFYVEERQSIMNYQLDVDNIMCSRKGHMKDINYTELMKAYKKN